MQKNLNDIHQELKDKCDVIDPTKLAVVQVGGAEAIVGEIDTKFEDDELVRLPDGISLRNPKRFIRIQGMTQHGMQINFMIADMDFMESGRIDVKPTSGYFVKWMNPESQLTFLKLYKELFDSKAINKARESGVITIPEGVGILKPRPR